MLYGGSATPLEYMAARDKMFHDVLDAFKEAGLQVSVALSFDDLCRELKLLWTDWDVQAPLFERDSILAENMPL